MIDTLKNGGRELSFRNFAPAKNRESAVIILIVKNTKMRVKQAESVIPGNEGFLENLTFSYCLYFDNVIRFGIVFTVFAVTGKF